jgi:hypothetical protein
MLQLKVYKTHSHSIQMQFTKVKFQSAACNDDNLQSVLHFMHKSYITQSMLSLKCSQTMRYPNTMRAPNDTIIS